MSLALAPVPPSSADAEDNVLGACMLTQGAIESVVDTGLQAEDFYRLSNGEIFKAILHLYGKGEPVDAITVAHQLPSQADRVHELARIVSTASNASHYARIVREMATRRNIIQVANRVSQRAYEGEGTSESLIAEADTDFLALQSGVKNSRERVFTGAQLAAEYRELLENPPDEDAIGVKAPFSFLTPLMGSRLYVLSGFTGHGKTAAALQFLASACEGGAKVGFHSIEMSRTDLTHRLIASFGVPYHDVRSGRPSSIYKPVFENALQKLEAWKFDVIDDERVDPSAVRRDQRAGKYDFLIIDHLHRIRIKDKRHAREELEENVRRITNTAKEFDIPILLLAQLSREEKRNPFPRPTLASLKGSGSIEQEAAVVWFVYRIPDEHHQPTTDAEWLIEKNRYGGLGSKNLHFRPSQVRFTEHSG